MINCSGKRERGVGPSRGGAGGRRRSNHTSRGVLALVLGCVLAGALLTAGPASADITASRAFRIVNSSSHPLRLESATKIPKHLCDLNGSVCVPTHYLIGFQERPPDGAVLPPASKSQNGATLVHTHVWELKYFFSLEPVCTFAAALKYKIEGTDGTLEVTIETCSYSNNSSCTITPAGLGHCAAHPFMGGRRILFYSLR
jgi:hypothetical protein